MCIGWVPIWVEVQMYISGHKTHLPLESPYLILKRYELESRAFIGFYEWVENNINSYLIKHTKIKGSKKYKCSEINDNYLGVCF